MCFSIQTFDAQPDADSLLGAKLGTFLLNPTNTSELTFVNFVDIYSDILKNNGSSCLWFYPASVSVSLCFLLLQP